jgi:hypothetical protein
MSEAGTEHGTSFERLLPKFGDSGRDFERLVKWFLMHDPDYAAIFREVWLWKDWPDRWGIDKGINLIAETHDGASSRSRQSTTTSSTGFRSATSTRFLANRVALQSPNGCSSARPIGWPATRSR